VNEGTVNGGFLPLRQEFVAMTSRLAWWIVTFMTVAAWLCLPPVASAQLNGPNIKGDMGLKAGSQPPPGGYVIVPVYFYSADELKDRNGEVLATGSLNATVYGAELNDVTTKKIGAADYGFMVVLPGANSRVQGGRIDEKSGEGLTDM
jgi:hypothetical protein